MHGHRRDEYKARLADPKIAAGMAQKAQQWNTLSQELLQRRRQPEASQERLAETLALTEKLLQVNPDPLTLWNHRRELLLQIKERNEKPFDVNLELVVTAASLERNPKAYGAWFHRKWSIRQMLLENNDSDVSLLEHELSLCAQLLQLDERNFHCWNYRRFVVAALLQICQDDDAGQTFDGSWTLTDDQDSVVIGAQIALHSLGNLEENRQQPSSSDTLNAKTLALLQSEWDFSTEKIQQNFSNFSAFHYRSKLLPLRLTTDTSRIAMARSELEDMVHNAIFTEPDDQTAWWYLRFLLVDWLAPCMATDEYKELLNEEEELLIELIDTEDGRCKWGWLALHMVLTQRDDQQHEVRINECLERLMELDPDRAARYESMKPL